MATIKEKLGARIQEIRKSKHLTQEKLAEMINVDIPNLSNIERGKRFVSSETLERIINALDVDEKDLFDFNHIKLRDKIMKEINDILNDFSDKELKYFYKIITAYKEI